METKPCRICQELEASLQSAQQPDPPALVLGLTEAGKRNRGLQRQELVQRIETLLETHESQCSAGWEQGQGISARSRTNKIPITHDKVASRR